MWATVIGAYSKTIDAVFRVLDWKKGRPKAKLEEQRKEWEELSREAQIAGDLHGMQRARAQIKEIDRRLESSDFK